MRRSSMRRGSAVLLSILPLLAPTYGLPTYMGNEGSVVTHMNAERAAVPVADRVTLDVSEPEHSVFDDIASPGGEDWLPTKREEKRQAPSRESIAAAEEEANNGGAGTGRLGGSALGNIGSYGPSMRLPIAKRDIQPPPPGHQNDRVKMMWDYRPDPVNQLQPTTKNTQ